MPIDAFMRYLVELPTLALGRGYCEYGAQVAARAERCITGGFCQQLVLSDIQSDARPICASVDLRLGSGQWDITALRALLETVLMSVEIFRQLSGRV